MSIKLWLGLAAIAAGSFFVMGYYARGRFIETAPPTMAVDTTATQATTQIRTITKVVTVREPAPDGHERTTTTQETTALENRVDKSKSVDSQPVAQQRQDRPRYSVGVLVTPRIDETWRDSYKPTAVELGARLGDSPISAIGSYDWRRREFQLGMRLEF